MIDDIIWDIVGAIFLSIGISLIVGSYLRWRDRP